MMRTMGVVLGVALLGFLAAGEARGDDKNACTVATKGDSPVAQACGEGGRDAAKKKMKELVKAASKGGLDKKCGNCHVNTKAFELRDNARDDFKKLLEAASK